MRTFRTEEEYVKYIQSDAFNVTAERNKAVFYAGRDGFNCAIAHLRYVKEGYQSIETTRGGNWLEREKLWGEEESYFGRPVKPEERIHKDEPTPPFDKEAAHRVWEAASQKYAQSVSGAVTCVVEDASDQTMFRGTELPELIKNKKVTHINGIEREELKELYDLDPSKNKQESLNHIFETIKKEPQQIAYEKISKTEKEQETARRFSIHNDRNETRFIEITGVKRGENIKGLELSEEHSRKIERLKPNEILQVSIKELLDSISREQEEQRRLKTR